VPIVLRILVLAFVAGLGACSSSTPDAVAPASAGSGAQAASAAATAVPEADRSLQRLRAQLLLQLGLDAELRADEFVVVITPEGLAVSSRSASAEHLARVAAIAAQLPDGSRISVAGAAPTPPQVQPVDPATALAQPIALATRREVEPAFPAEGSATSINRAASGDRPRTWRVRSGDTLSLIAARTMGNGNQWRRLYEYNRSTIGANPERLQEGMELRIPQD
jgi:nucleoid-associated protein YgaU